MTLHKRTYHFMSSIIISQPVGRDGANQTPDVRIVQNLLNRNLFRVTPLAPLKVDGSCGPLTVGVICEFQRRAIGFLYPDGRIDPNGKTFSALTSPEREPKNLDRSPSQFCHELLDLQQWVKARTPQSASADPIRNDRGRL